MLFRSGVTTSLNAMELAGFNDQETALYFYDRYVGGLGFSEKIYDLMSLTPFMSRLLTWMTTAQLVR